MKKAGYQIENNIHVAFTGARSVEAYEIWS